MTYNKKKSSFKSNTLTPKKIGFIIQDLKENCILCKQDAVHECCISVIIDEWRILKNEKNYKSY